MSRSNKTNLPNPASRFYQWKGNAGHFQYYDKSLGEKGETVVASLPLRFMVLDSLSTIKGYSESQKRGFWANEVRDVRKDILTVHVGGNVVAEGLYQKGVLIARPECRGAKYCQSVYVAIRIGNKLEIANLQLTGAALSSWFEFRKKEKDVEDGVIEVVESVENKKGAVTFRIPVFHKISSNAAAEAQAEQLDKILQVYLTSYLKRDQDAAVVEHVAGATQEAYEDGYGNTSDAQDGPEYEEHSDDSDLPF